MKLFITTMLLLATSVGVAQNRTDAEQFDLLVQQGLSAYDSGEFEAAITFFTQALAISEDPQVVLHLGHCYRDLQRYEEAAAAYRRYLELAPQAKDRGKIERLLQEMDGEIPLAQDHTADSTPVDIPPKADLKAGLGWSLIGLAAASTGLAIYFQVSAVSAEDEAQQCADSSSCADTTYTDLSDDASWNQNVATVFFICGGVSLVAGVVLLLLPDEEEQAVVLRLMPGWLKLGVQF